MKTGFQNMREIARYAKDNDLIIAMNQRRLNALQKVVSSGEVKFFDIIKGNKQHQIIALKDSRTGYEEHFDFTAPYKVTGFSEKGYIFIS